MLLCKKKHIIVMRIFFASPRTEIACRRYLHMLSVRVALQDMQYASAIPVLGGGAGFTRMLVYMSKKVGAVSMRKARTSRPRHNLHKASNSIF